METLSTEYHQVFFKTQDEVGFKRFLTFDLYLGQVKGHRKISYKKCLGQGRKYLGMNEFCPSLPGKPGGPKPAWIYIDTGGILVSQFKVT